MASESLSSFSARSRAAFSGRLSDRASALPIRASPRASSTSVSVFLVHFHDRCVIVGLFGGEFVDHRVDGFDDRIERVLITGQQHPAGKAARPLLVERVERQIDHLARVTQTGAGWHGPHP